MNVSLDQAIEIHAKALFRRRRANAPRWARDQAHRCQAVGDHEGHVVWLKVAATADTLLNVRTSSGALPNLGYLLPRLAGGMRTPTSASNSCFARRTLSKSDALPPLLG